MVKILGISGSPRKGGNTLELVEEALKAASEVTEVECKLITLWEGRRSFDFNWQR